MTFSPSRLWLCVGLLVARVLSRLVAAWWFFGLFLILAIFNSILGGELLFLAIVTVWSAVNLMTRATNVDGHCYVRVHSPRPRRGAGQITLVKVRRTTGPRLYCEVPHLQRQAVTVPRQVGGGRRGPRLARAAAHVTLGYEGLAPV